MSKKRLCVIVIAVILFAFSAVLATSLILGDKEPEAREIEIFEQVEKSEEGIQGFVFVEPGPSAKKHIGDPIKVSISVGYESEKWEVPKDLEEVFMLYSFLPEQFKIEERKLNNTKHGKFTLREVSIIARCLECRYGSYSVSIDAPGLFPRARYKQGTTNNIRAIPFFDTRNALIEFAPLTDSSFKTDDSLISLSLEKQAKWRWPLFVFLMICALAFLGFIIYILKHSYGSTEKEVIAVDKRQRIIDQINKVEMPDVLYNLLIIWKAEYGDESGNISVILEDLNQAYSKEGISKEALRKLIEGSIKWTQ